MKPDPLDKSRSIFSNEENGSLLNQPRLEKPRIADHELLRRIGGGSYGEVWLARNAIGSLHAVKIIYRNSFSNDRPFEREFEGIQKAMPVSRIIPGLVQILHVGRNDEAGYFYYVMELADNGAVSSFEFEVSSSRTPMDGPKPETQNSKPETYVPRTLQSEAAARGPLPVEECVALAQTLTEALGQLHAQGLVHRDIKPSNIIFVRGAPKLADIGLMANASEAQSFVGTAGFIPPEGPGTPQADLYSLGKVLYEISTGKDRQEFPQLPGDLAEQSNAPQLIELNAIILKACQPDARARYQSADAMHAELELLRGGQSIRRKRTIQSRLAWAKRFLLATAVFSLLAVGVWLLHTRFNASTNQRINGVPEINSIAVLPFDNDSPEKADEYLGSQMAEEIGGALARIPNLRVLGRSSATSLKNTRDVRAIAQSLGLGTLLDGRVRKTGNRLQFNCQLLNATNDSVLWAHTFDGEIAGIFGLQTLVAEGTALALGVKLPESVRTRLAVKSTKELQAYQFYLEGRFHWYKHSGEGLRQAVAAFERAIALDPGYAKAYAGLADVWNVWEDLGLGWPKESMPKAKEAALKAVALDEGLAEAHTALGNTLAQFEWKWKEAEEEYKRAIELDPAYPSARQFYAQLLDATGRSREALEQIRHGVKLDPAAPRMRVNLVVRLCNARRFEEAIAQIREIRALHPDYTNPYFGRVYEEAGRYDEAVEEWSRHMIRSGADLATVNELRAVYASSGIRGYWQKRLEQTIELSDRQKPVSYGSISPGNFAETYLRAGNHERALDFLEQMVEVRAAWAMHIASDATWKPLRSHPRFIALLKKLSLEANPGNTKGR